MSPCSPRPQATSIITACIPTFMAPMTKAAIAAGADGVMIEVHDDPERALSDGAQSLKPERFAQLVRQVRAIALDVERR